MKRHIVVFSNDLDHAEFKQKTLPALDGKVLKYLPLVNAAVVLRDSATQRKDLSRQDGVAKVFDDVKIYAVETAAALQPPQVLPWGVDRIDAEKVWNISTGAQVNVAVIDTGIDTRHPDLKVHGGINTINPQKSYKDDSGHGTHVAGTIAALSNRVGVVGVAFNARLYSVKVLGADGSGYLSDLIEGLDWCIKNKIHVVNMSLGSDNTLELLHDVIKQVYNAGILLVAAAGNSGPEANTVYHPARYPEVIAVSATDPFDGIAYFSSRGPEVDLAAPGVNIHSTYRNKAYRKFSDTSMAAPHVSGTAALLLAHKAPMKPDEVLNRLRETAQDLHHSPEEQGAGLIDAYAAVTE